MCDRVLTLYRPCAYPGAVLRHASGATGPRSSESFFVDQILARMSVIIEASLRLGPTKLSFLGQITREMQGIVGQASDFVEVVSKID